jgi:hypothetical protein
MPPNLVAINPILLLRYVPVSRVLVFSLTINSIGQSIPTGGLDVYPAVDHRERTVCGPVRVDIIYHNDSPCHPAYRSAAVPRSAASRPVTSLGAFTAVDEMTG